MDTIFPNVHPKHETLKYFSLPVWTSEHFKTIKIVMYGYQSLGNGGFLPLPHFSGNLN